MENMAVDFEDLGKEDYSMLLAELADKFFPIFVTIFSFIALGYLAGRFNILPTGRGKPVLASYIFNIALPAGILYNVLTVKLTCINSTATQSLHNFIYGIVIVKTFLYIAVIFIGLILVRRSVVSWAVVFLFALASVHSNDYAIGQELLFALFDNSTFQETTDYPSYMEDSMVLTYATYAPITIFFLELRRNRELSLTWGKSLLYALIRSLLRPAVLAAILGVILRFIFGIDQSNKLLSANFFKWFGNGILRKLCGTIAPIYLLYTGLVLVGSVNHFTCHKQVMAIVAITILKLGLSPLLMKCTQLFITADKSTSDSLSILFYLYGTLPTSPIVVIFASQYDLMTPAFAMIVLATTLSFAPVSTLFLSLYYVSWCQLFSEETSTLVNNLTEGIGYAGVGLAIWILLVLLFLGRFRRFMYHFLIGQVLCLLMYTALIGGVMVNEVGKTEAKLIAFGKAVASCLFCLLGSAYPFILGLADRGNMFGAFFTKRVAVWFICICVLLPIILLGLTSLPFPANDVTPHDYIWDYSNNISKEFVITKLTILSIAICLTVVPKFVGFCRSRTVRREYFRFHYEPLEETSELSTGMRDFHNNKMGRSISYASESNPWEVSEREASKFQIIGFISVVMAMITILVEVWGVFERASGSKTFVGLVLLYQNIWLFVAIFMAAVFGTPIAEIREKLIMIKEALVRCVLKEEELSLPQLEALAPDTVLTCQRFIQYHLAACISAIGQSVQGTFGRSYEDVFTGEDLVSWLINVGLAEDRTDAVEYGSKLVLGRVMEHIDKRRSFYDRNYFYRFAREIPASVARSRSLNGSSSELRDEFHFTRTARSLPDWF